MMRDSGAEATDAQLIVGSQDDVTLFGELYDRNVDAVLGYHYRRTGCAQTAADLTAETFAVAFTARRRFSDTGAPGRAWLLAIAKRQVARFYRRQRVATRARRRLGIEQHVALDDTEMARIEALVDFAPMRSALAEALGDLPATQADAVWLRVGHELSYREIAARLGCSEGAARVRVSRALARLTEAMEGAAP